MTHEHGSEYQVRIVREDDSEELSGWLSCQEKVAEAIARLHGMPAKAYWLQVRDVVCLNCVHRELTIGESRLILTAAGNIRVPRQTERIPFAHASRRTSSGGA